MTRSCSIPPTLDTSVIIQSARTKRAAETSPSATSPRNTGSRDGLTSAARREGRPQALGVAAMPGNKATLPASRMTRGAEMAFRGDSLSCRPLHFLAHGRAQKFRHRDALLTRGRCGSGDEIGVGAKVHTKGGGWTIHKHNSKFSRGARLEKRARAQWLPIY